MIREGESAPTFSLPAVADGEVCEVALDDYLGEDIIILAFYPADFNPACDGEATDLDELDLFTMQKDVSILGISGDSVYSHREFAEKYDLHIPLLSDTDGEVARAYGVAVDDPAAGYRLNRAVVVIDPDGEVVYAWQTEKLTRLPPVERVRNAVQRIGGGDAAMARYRVGHAHYVEGRRSFTSAMGEFKELEWMMAQGDFGRAHEEFEEATDQFNTAVRFAVDDGPRTYFERAEEKADALAQAAEWLEQAASAYASGEGAEGEDLRSDAERPLETARDIHEPPDPDDFPPADDPAAEETQESILPGDDEGPAATLDADIDGESEDGTATSQTESTPGDAGSAPHAPGGGQATASADAGAEEPHEDGEANAIDDEELEEIAAELEAQNEQAAAERDAADGDTDVVPAEAAEATEDGTGADSVDDDLSEDGTLDLADPTDGDDAADDEDEDEDDSTASTDDDLGDGNHGVPDSL